MLIYEVVTRELPYDGAGPQQIIKKVYIEHELPDMSKVEEGCPTDLNAIMHECLVPAPTERPGFADLVPRIREGAIGCGVGCGYGSTEVMSSLGTVTVGSSVQERLRIWKEMEQYRQQHGGKVGKEMDHFRQQSGGAEVVPKVHASFASGVFAPTLSGVQDVVVQADYVWTTNHIQTEGVC